MITPPPMTPPSAHPHAELYVQARNGDGEAFAALVESHRPAVFARLRKKLSDPHDQADVWQETIIAAWRSLAEVRDPARLGGWLGQIAAHKADGWHRRRYAQARLADLLEEPGEPAPPASNAGGDAASDRLALAAAFRRLSRDHRSVILGHYHHGQTYQQLSASLQITPGLVRSRLQKARARLKSEIEKTMTTSTETLHLTSDDIQVLLALSGVSYRGEHPRPAIRGVLLDAPNLRATSTDGRHLATRRIPALQALGQSLIVQGWEAAAHGQFSEGATLSLGLADAVLTDSSGEPFPLTIVDADFPKHDGFIGIQAPGGALVPTQSLQEAIDEITPFLSDRHPVDSGKTYTPLVRLELREDGVFLSTHEGLGYALANENAEAQSPRVPRWRHEVALPAGAADGKICAASTLVNADLITSALRALAAGNPDKLRVAYDPATPVLLIAQADSDADLALVMPVKSES